MFCLVNKCVNRSVRDMWVQSEGSWVPVCAEHDADDLNFKRAKKDVFVPEHETRSAPDNAHSGKSKIHPRLRGKLSSHR